MVEESIKSQKPIVDVVPLMHAADLLITDISSVGFEFLQLDRPIVFMTFDNQLRRWEGRADLETWGRKTGAGWFRYDGADKIDPPSPDQAPRLAVWDDSATGSLDARARAYLEINCAHCHQPTGQARNSGLDLLTAETNPTRFGIFKTPVAAGRGSGGFDYDILPGNPDRSILAHRMTSTDAGVMMPELGKRLEHTEGADLIRRWIAEMPPAKPPTRPR